MGNGAWSAVTPDEVDRSHPTPVLDQPRPDEDRADVLRAQWHVLDGERVDRRRDDDQPLVLDPLRCVLPPREHQRLCRPEVWPQELPRGPREVVGPVASHVAAPDHSRPHLAQACGEPGGLGIMEQDDVTRRDPRCQVREVGAEHRLVVLTLLAPEGPAVPRFAVQRVVQPLRDGEERRVAVQHQPPVLDAGSVAIGQQGLQHLGDPTSVRGGVDMPHHPVAEGCPCPLGGSHQPRCPVGGKDGREPVQCEWLDEDLFHDAMVACRPGTCHACRAMFSPGPRVRSRP
jgi:hypothetical protein